MTLLKRGVTVGLAAWDATHAQGTRFDLGWVRMLLWLSMDLD